MRIADQIRNRTIEHLTELKENFKTRRAGPFLIITDHAFRNTYKIAELFHRDLAGFAKPPKIRQEIASKLN